MTGSMVSESWFNTLRRKSRLGTIDNNDAVGVLSSEIACLMSKVVSLWHCLADAEISRLKIEISNSAEIKILVSKDENLMELALNEILEQFKFIAKHVARLGRKCVDPVYHQYEQFVHDPVRYGLDWLGWEYRLEKMERKVKKMKRFVDAVEELSQELEVLAEIEQNFKRIQSNRHSNSTKLHEYQQKLLFQKQKVKSLKELSPWMRTYDCIVRLLVRSLFTILERIILVFRNNHVNAHKETSDFQLMYKDQFLICGAFSASIYQHESRNISSRVRTSVSKGRLEVDKQVASPPEIHLYPATKQLDFVGDFKGWLPIIGGSKKLKTFDAEYLNNVKIDGAVSVSWRKSIYVKLSLKCNLVKPYPSTLGHAALAFHYANVIILIEKMVKSPDLIDMDTRDDLYDMLSSTIRSALRTRLKSYRFGKASCACNGNTEAEWKHALSHILVRLAPLAHNMVAWHSKRSAEKQYNASMANVLLAQTLYFADKAKIEAAIVELFVGLNYIFRSGKTFSQFQRKMQMVQINRSIHL